MPQTPQHIIGQTELKHYNQFRSIRTESLRWLKFTAGLGGNFKVETDT